MQSLVKELPRKFGRTCKNLVKMTIASCEFPLLLGSMFIHVSYPIHLMQTYRKKIIYIPDVKNLFLSGTIISGTPRLLNSAGNRHQHKLQRPDGCNTGQSSVHSRDTTSPCPSPASGRNSRLTWIHASPEGLLKQRAHPRLARGPVRAGFAVKQPWPDHLANRPYRRSIQCKDRLTPYPNARSSVGRVEVTAVTSPLH
jgi:hypothetical protein